MCPGNETSFAFSGIELNYQGPEHTIEGGGASAQPSYCTLSMFHPPMSAANAPARFGYVSCDGHHFECRNPVGMQHAFHVCVVHHIFIIDAVLILNTTTHSIFVVDRLAMLHFPLFLLTENRKSGPNLCPSKTYSPPTLQGLNTSSAWQIIDSVPRLRHSSSSGSRGKPQ